jgi:ribosomal protein S18 acetylase RimI-like enzyme
MNWAHAMSTMEIREFDSQCDREPVRRCFVELQEFERALDQRLPSGEQIADPYLDLMFQRCREFSGVVLVAEVDRAVVGFVTIWTRYRSSEPDDDPAEHGFISDLVVSATHRGRGIGRLLLRAAEARAREAGARTIQLSVKAGNAAARALYAAEGFADAEIYLEKPL